MKNKCFLATMAAVVLGMTTLASAQQGYFNPELGDGRWSAARPAVSPAYTQYEHFNPEIGNVPVAIAPDAAAMGGHAGRSGSLKIASITKLGGVMLNPGKYQVRHIESAKDHFVEFSRTVENDYAPEGQPVYETKVVARVHCTREPADTVVAHTELLPNSTGTTARLEIRGEKTVHTF